MTNYVGLLGTKSFTDHLGLQNTCTMFYLTMLVH